MMRSSWRLGRWRGIPISLHWTVFIGIPWFLFQTRSVTGAAIMFVGFFVILLVHELGHAAVARWRQVDVEQIRLLFLHGTCTLNEEPYHELDDVLIAWGGVAAQFALLVIALVADIVLGAFSPVAEGLLSPLFRVLIATNLFIIIFNLIPLAPFDGAKAWRALPLLAEWWKQTSWATSLRRRSAAREKSRTQKLEASSERIAADIIDKLKKGKSDV